MHGQPVVLTLQTAGFHQPADTEAAALRHFAVCNLGRREEEHEIAPECVQHQCRSECYRNQSNTDHGKPFLARGHCGPPSAIRYWAISLKATARLCRNASTSHTIHRAVAPNDGHTYIP